MKQTDERAGVASIEKAFSIVELLKREGQCRLSEVARQLDMPKSTVHNHLSTLEGMGYVVQRGGEYELGLRFLSLGERARRKRPGYDLVGEKVEELAAETGERALFLVEEGGRDVYLHLELGDDAVETGAHLGDLGTNFHASAAGKVLLAYASDRGRERILERMEFPQLTPETVTDRGELFAELERVRQRGVAFNREELLVGLQAVAVPVMYDDDSLLGALCVSGPTHRVRGERLEESLPDLLAGVASEVEMKLTQPLRG